jgi:predicted transcriptional regulator of viral defense system
MQFFDLKETLNDFVVFKKTDIQKIDADFHIQRFSEWQKKGYIKKIRQGFYVFSDLTINEQALFLIANTIYKPSYISLEMAFSFYNIIPESVYEITSITSLKTMKFNTDVGTFSYRHIKPNLMFGYTLIQYNNHSYMVADIEKALLDYLYLNQKIKDQRDFESLRLNKQELRLKINKKKLDQYLKLFENNNLEKRINKLIEYIQYD